MFENNRGGIIGMKYEYFNIKVKIKNVSYSNFTSKEPLSL